MEAKPGQGWSPSIDLAIRWPQGLSGAPLPSEWSLGAGEMRLKGDLHGSVITAETPVLGEGVLREGTGTSSPVLVGLLGTIHPAGFQMKSLTLREQDTQGMIEAKGRFHWRDQQTADLDLTVRDFDPGRLAADWPGAVNLDAAVQVKMDDDGAPAIAGQLQNLEGQLRGYPLSGSGRWDWRGDTLSVDKLDVRSGNNQLNASGRLSGLTGNSHLTGNLEGHLSLLEPDAILPGAQGTAEANFSARFEGSESKLEAALNSPAFAWPEAELSSENISLDLSWLGPIDEPLKGSGKLESRIKQLALPDLSLRDLKLAWKGGFASHDLDLSSQVKASDTTLTVDTTATGGWGAPDNIEALADSPWKGQLLSLNLDSKPSGPWTLRQPSPVTLSTSQAGMEQLCLDSKPTSLCSDLNWTASKGVQGLLKLRDLSVARIEKALNALTGSGLPEGLAIQASLGADARLAGEDVTVSVLPTEGQLTLKDPPLDIPANIPFRLEALDYQLQQGRTQAEAVLDMGRYGHLDADAGLSPSGDTQSLQGEINARATDLSWLQAALPQVEGLKGELSLRVALAGTLEKPILRPHGELAVSQAELPNAGISLRHLKLALDPVIHQTNGTPNEAIVLADVAISGGTDLIAPEDPEATGINSGRLLIDGRLSGDGQTIQLAVKGDRVPVLRLPDISLDLAPDLNFESVSGAKKVSGTLHVPHGLYKAVNLPKGSVTVSSDEVIIGEDTALDDQRASAAPNENKPDHQGEKPAGVQADLLVTLGDDVRIDAFDLKARLGGRLKVKLIKGRETAEGRIELSEANYKAYGQDLSLEHGFLLFNGPADDPSLDLRASRRSVDGKTTAYLDVSGTLREPKFDVSTQPPGSDADALAYLLAGRPLNQANNDQKFNVYAAALSMGLDKGEPLFANVRRELGLDELELAAGSTLQDTTLSLGKYVNPDLFVGYSINLLDRAGAVLLRL
ncbi:MAG: translocation/assembly module TamB domain-containing protein, partial [Gammaproteobacteria bacterium]